MTTTEQDRQKYDKLYKEQCIAYKMNWRTEYNRLEKLLVELKGVHSCDCAECKFLPF